jgi:hypothetical protein
MWRKNIELGVKTADGLLPYLYYPFGDSTIRLVPKADKYPNGEIKICPRTRLFKPLVIDGQYVYALPGGGVVLDENKSTK